MVRSNRLLYQFLAATALVIEGLAVAIDCIIKDYVAATHLRRVRRRCHQGVERSASGNSHYK